jgi:hypothetical protein
MSPLQAIEEQKKSALADLDAKRTAWTEIARDKTLRDIELVKEANEVKKTGQESSFLLQIPLSHFPDDLDEPDDINLMDECHPSFASSFQIFAILPVAEICTPFPAHLCIRRQASRIMSRRSARRLTSGCR